MNLATRAVLVASAFAVDAHGLGGVCLRSSAGAPRDQWLQLLRQLLPQHTTLRRMPFNISDARLLGGLDLAATLRCNRAIADQGLLAAADHGVVAVAMAERLSAHTAALLCNVLEQGEVRASREGLEINQAARIAVVALDEGLTDEESVPLCLLDRCAFLLDFALADARTQLLPPYDRAHLCAARALLPRVAIEPVYVQALCATAIALGAGSVRVSILAVHTARVLAALDGNLAVGQREAEMAGSLVLAPRASAIPESMREAAPHEAPPAPADPAASTAEPATNLEAGPQTVPQDLQQMQDSVLAATQSAIPPGLLTQLRVQKTGSVGSPRGAMGGRYGALRKGGARGRPVGVVPAGAERTRFNIVETLRAAAPWQSLRGRAALEGSRLQIRPQDLRVTRYKQRSRTLTVFVVDASGSAALNRLAETKGAAELLLADCYVRRDQVAVVAFRGREAQVLLPPTRSLVRAKRSLSALPGGGGTPLAAAIDAAMILASQAQRRGESPTVVMLTDGRGNVARDGRVGREAGQADALKSARVFASARISALFVDTSSRPHPLARDLARSMGANYIPLPFADAHTLSRLVIGKSGARAAAS